ncbi:MAG: PilZ domain-containing protein [Phycisphaerae bacterium]|nr:PilZ domain-containing protein [Phycisphaerae bacterium]
MPANRSRTERWRECMQQIADRQGGLELSFDRPQDQPTPDLVWRVRVLEVGEEDLVVEAPIAVGKAIDLPGGTTLVGGMTIGQNRWMFRTTVVRAERRGNSPVLRLRAPENVERCSRRALYRISTAELCLPVVECWPLLNPLTAIPAEIACRAHARMALAAGGNVLLDPPSVLPDVGPSFKARLANISGGGAGLVIERQDAASVDRVRQLWLRVDLRPAVVAPIALSAKVAHTHIDSAQNLYLGVAFDFSLHLEHRQFVTEQLVAYVERLRHQTKAA